ncbi:hypothetical protein TorRG33x02_280590 [Trema orientale]|uniref:Uncharacterized protein n=1 Tax=Trema orientale TaxID=63057 RepID=A0A2P5CLH1_TREOI|nr:hypothetical protein TorRG33x02_280590 [Trema orientale]
MYIILFLYTLSRWTFRFKGLGFSSDLLGEKESGVARLEASTLGVAVTVSGCSSALGNGGAGDDLWLSLLFGVSSLSADLLLSDSQNSSQPRFRW